ncbi:terminase TerL endonuclease subunit [Nocardia wallacei]|uniref:terminase TerL endonuclease subunit n=1 Tax=Nocardia wallacei TaxID=480035 RepID=UPI00313AFB6F
MARGALRDETTFGVIWAADPKADPFAEETQRTANPGFGISPTRAFLRQAAVKAQQSPADLASYLRLHLGIRTKQQTKYLDLDAWDRNASIVDELRLRGRKCYGGLDLASTSDLCALCWVFPDEDRSGFDLLWRLWTPVDNVAALDKRTAGAASAWVKAGILTATPGNVADYDYIHATVMQDAEIFDVAEIAYDRWNSTQLVNDLTADGAPMVTMGQGYASMSSPTKELQRLVLSGTEETPVMRHGGNPAVRWMVDNFAVAMDPAGNVKPDKANAADKIDAVAALIMALSRAIAAGAEQTSACEDDGLMVV